MVDFNDDDDMELGETSSMKEVRDYAKKLERTIKAMKRENESLEEFRTSTLAERDKARAESMFSEAGLNAKQAALYRAMNPGEEPTEDGIKAFAEEYGLTAPPVSEAPAAEEEEDPFGALVEQPAPIAVPGQPANRKYTAEEFWKMHADNPADALRLVKEGRVQLAGDFKDLAQG